MLKRFHQRVTTLAQARLRDRPVWARSSPHGQKPLSDSWIARRRSQFRLRQVQKTAGQAADNPIGACRAQTSTERSARKDQKTAVRIADPTEGTAYELVVSETG